MRDHDLRLARRLAGLLLAMTAAVAPGCHNEENAVSAPSGPTLDAATKASKALSDYFASNIKVLEGVLSDMQLAGAQTPELAAKLAAARAKLPDHAMLMVFDAKRQLVAGDFAPEGLPPYKVVMPLLRKTEQANKPMVTEVWTGNDKKFWVAQGRMMGEGATAQTAVVAFPVAGKTTAALLGALQKDPAQNVQVFDDVGFAVWSTKPEDRFKSAVHGTYLLDRIQTGQPFQTKCHNCHEDAQHKVVRTDVIITVVPVAGTKWGISVR